MSGGHFDYKNDDACREIFGWGLDPNYGERGRVQASAAARMNPLEDRLISELVWDVFCLLHSFDWYKCGDNCEEKYLADVEAFKKKWFYAGDIADHIIDLAIKDCKNDIYKALGYPNLIE